MTYTFWVAAVLLLHAWGTYLLVLRLFSFLRDKEVGSDAHTLPVTVLLTVFNEEKNVRGRIDNILSSNYPKDRLDVLVVSDASTDATDSIVESIAAREGRVRLMRASRGGKSAAQNAAMASAKGEMVVITDADTVFERDTIANLVRPFSDPSVGCTSGRVVLRGKENSVSEGQGFYWRFEMALRRLESKVGLLHTASGSVMAFRKAAFVPFECQYGDDCIIPLDIISQGYKVVHVDDAIAYDSFPSSIEGELRARTRMTLRNLTCTLSRMRLLNPFRHPLISFSMLSHKILRWLTPFFLIVLFLSNVFLLPKGVFYQIIFGCQILFYVLAAIGYRGERQGRRIPLCSQAFSFVLANLGFFWGVCYAIMGKEITAYRRS